MKSLRVQAGVYALAFVFTVLSATAAKKPVGYNVGVCAPNGFVSLHLEIAEGESVSATAISRGPGEQEKLPKPVVYNYTNTDKAGKHYASASNKDLEIVISKEEEKTVIGSVRVDGEDVGSLFGVAASEDTLANDAINEYKVCVDLMKGDDSDKN